MVSIHSFLRLMFFTASDKVSIHSFLRLMFFTDSDEVSIHSFLWPMCVLPLN